MSEYRRWDREEKLGKPPWKPDDPKLIAWERAHGHDVRLKCYPEFECQLVEVELDRLEALLRGPVHGLIQTIRGMCSDERPWVEIDAKLRELDDLACPTEGEGS